MSTYRLESRVLAVALSCIAFTSLVFVVPPMHFAYPVVGAAVSLAAFASVSALSIAVLFYLRAQRAPNVCDTLIAFLFGITALLEGVLPLVAELDRSTASIAFWSRVTGRTIVAVGLCVAAWYPERASVRRFSARTMLAAVVAGFGIIVGTTIARSSTLPSIADSTEPDVLTGDLMVRGFRLFGAALLVLAALGFIRRARQGQDFFGLLAVAAVLLSAARLQDFLYPALRDDLLTTADILRFAAYGVLVFAALHEIAQLWRSRAADARARERRRLAAELHDGLAQELAYLSTLAAMAARNPANSDHLEKARAAAERALLETRYAIAEYTRVGPVALDLVLAELAEDVETRFGCNVALDVEELVVDATTAHELSRVAREALVNAARHAQPGQILVSLRTRPGVVTLSVTDDGGGIVTDAVPEGRFGLGTMRDRAERLGGRCSIGAAPPNGTRVAIEIPLR
jgi:signal transduction histidine kinase